MTLATGLPPQPHLTSPKSDSTYRPRSVKGGRPEAVILNFHPVSIEGFRNGNKRRQATLPLASRPSFCFPASRRGLSQHRSSIARSHTCASSTATAGDNLRHCVPVRKHRCRFPHLCEISPCWKVGLARFQMACGNTGEARRHALAEAPREPRYMHLRARIRRNLRPIRVSGHLGMAGRRSWGRAWLSRGGTVTRLQTARRGLQRQGVGGGKNSDE